MLNQNNMPGAGSINETLEFMRNMWGSMGAPAMGIPSLSVEEINKKISDLKTVASWLELNMNMLRATIQTMEVQSATLSTLQAMGAILTPREAQSGAADATADRAATASGFANWPEPSFKPAPAEAVADAGEGTPEAAPEQTDAARTAEPQAAAVPDFQATMTNPNAWWNLLQEQFQQAVGNVLAEQQPAVAKASPAAAKATAKSARAAQAPAPAPKKTTKAKPAAKAGTRAKSAVVQSAPSKSVSRKPKSP
jgi:hypothetical protein